jgi:superoxide dismutase, Cu-Zn family
MTVEYFIPQLTIDRGKARLLDDDGSALVIHAKADDYKSDPAGDAGDRIACGVIERSK